MIRQHHRVRNADEERRNEVVTTLLVDRDDGGGRLAVDEARENGKVREGAVPQGLEGLAVSCGDIGVHDLPHALIRSSRRASSAYSESFFAGLKVRSRSTGRPILARTVVSSGRDT